MRDEPMPPLSDESLMTRFQRRRDAAAMQELVGRYAARALAVARQMLFDRALAEDAVQDTFLRVMNAARSYDPARAFSTWFYTVLRNLCMDMLRRRRREIRAMQQRLARAEQAGLVDPPIVPEPESASQMLAGLASPIRRAVILRVIEDLPFRDVAAALGISEEAAKKRVQRGLRALRESPAVKAAADR
jgi:RNA polymerase sigma-70 factor (ECF subfamily)